MVRAKIVSKETYVKSGGMKGIFRRSFLGIPYALFLLLFVVFPLLLIVAVSCVFALALYPVARRRRRHPFAFVLLVSTVVFFALYAAFVLYNWKSGRFSTDSVWARLWMGGGEDAQEFHVITGAILSIDRKLLIRAFAGFIPAILGGGDA